MLIMNPMKRQINKITLDMLNASKIIMAIFFYDENTEGVLRARYKRETPFKIYCF